MEDFQKNKNEKDFKSSEEVLSFIKSEKNTSFPFAYTIGKNSSIIIKSNLFENEEEIRNSITADVIGQSDYIRRDFSSTIDKNLFLNGGINLDTNFYGINFKNDSNFNQKEDLSNKKFSSAISILLYKAKVKIPLSTIKIKKSIEDKIEKIIFGETYKDFSVSEKKKLIQDFLYEYGFIIPTSMIIGARYNYLIEGDDKSKIDSFQMETKNKFSYLNEGGNVDFNMFKNEENFTQGLKVEINNIGCSFCKANEAEWFNNLEKIHYDVILVQESYRIFECLRPELKERVQEWFLFSERTKSMIEKENYKKLLKYSLENRGEEREKREITEDGIVFGASLNIIDRYGITYETKNYSGTHKSDKSKEIEFNETFDKDKIIIGYKLKSDTLGKEFIFNRRCSIIGNNKLNLSIIIPPSHNISKGKMILSGFIPVVREVYGIYGLIKMREYYNYELYVYLVKKKTRRLKNPRL